VEITLWGAVVIAALILIAVGVYLLTLTRATETAGPASAVISAFPQQPSRGDDEPAPSQEDHELDDGEPEQPWNGSSYTRDARARGIRRGAPRLYAMRNTAVMAAPEKFVIQTPAELSEGIEQLAEAKLAEDGLRRVSEWEWRDHTEAAEEFEERVAFLQSKIGQPRFLGTRTRTTDR
jgi:hypothetical protein